MGWSQNVTFPDFLAASWPQGYFIVIRYFSKIPWNIQPQIPSKNSHPGTRSITLCPPILDTCQNKNAMIGQLADYINLSPFCPRDKIAYFQLSSCHIYHTCSCISSGSISAGSFACEIFIRRNFIPLQVGHGRERAQSPEWCVKVIECFSPTAGQCEIKGSQHLFLRCKY